MFCNKHHLNLNLIFHIKVSKQKPSFFRWADQCPEDHDKNRLIPGFAYVGQNKADSWSSINSPERDLAGKVLAWYDEVKKYLELLS